MPPILWYGNPLMSSFVSFPRSRKLFCVVAGLTLLLAGCGGGGGGGSSSGSSLTRGLIHEWKFNGNAQDSVGALDGTVVGSPTYGGVAAGKGIVLDGTTTGIDVPIVADTQFQASFTVSAWVKMNALPPDSRLWASILFNGDDRPGDDPYALLVGPGGDLQFQLMGTTNYFAVTGTMPVGQLVLVTGTYDQTAGTMRLYLDGQMVGEHLNDTTLTPVVTLDSSQHAGIGIGNANGFPDGLYNWGLDGTIADVRMYNRALTATEVQSLYKKGV